AARADGVQRDHGADLLLDAARGTTEHRSRRSAQPPAARPLRRLARRLRSAAALRALRALLAVGILIPALPVLAICHRWRDCRPIAGDRPAPRAGLPGLG